MSDEPTIYIVDDEPEVLRSLRFLIESVGLHVETYGSCQEFLQDYNAEAPGCLVLDMRLPGMSGLELQTALREEGHEIPVIVISGHADVPTAVQAMKGGAVHFLEKPFSDQELLDQINEALERDRWNRRRRASHQEIERRIEQLTRRERQVLELVVSGLKSREIARRLGVSQKTVEAHRNRIMKKMEVHNVSHLVRMVLTEGAAGDALEQPADDE